VEQEEAAAARQWRGKHDSAARDSDATIEDQVFSMWSKLGLYNEVTGFFN
jgi:hypothetical protein